MIFLAPWFLLGTLAAAIPLLLHLRRSRQRKKIVFSTTRFFDEQFLRSARRARVQDRLLMFLRMALLILFALALAQPLLRIPGLSGIFGSGKRTVAIVLDDSASMAAGDARGSQLDRAKAAAKQLVDDLSTLRGDRVTIVLAGRRAAGPTVLFDPPTSDLEQARQAIAQVTLSDLATDVQGALDKAGEVLGTASGQQEIDVISDLADAALPAATPLDPGPTRGLMMVSTQPAQSPANVSVDAVQYSSPRPLLGVPFTFRALVNTDGDPMTVNVNLIIDDKIVATRSVELAAGQRQMVRFVHRFADGGWHTGRIEVDGASLTHPDALDADNRRYFALFVNDRIRIGVMNGAASEIASADELFFFRAALGAGANETPVTIDTLDASRLDADKLAAYPMLILANVSALSPAALAAIEHAVDGGTNLLITLGDRVDMDAYNAMIGPARLHGGLLPGRLTQRLDDPTRGGFVAWVDPSHPAMAGFDAGELGRLASIKFDKRFALEPGGASVLMETDGGDALMTEKAFGRGRVMMFVSTLDRDWNNLPLEPLFVPWVYRVVSYLSEPPVGRSGFFATGDTVQLPRSIASQQSPLITTPGGRPAYADAAMRFSQTDRAGVYTVRDAGAPASAPPLYAFAVNMPHDESRLSYLNKAAVGERVDPAAAWVYIDQPESIAQAARAARQGWGLWDALLVIALMVGLFEPALANWLSRRREAAEANPLSRRDAIGDGAPAAKEAA
ncbi:MAG: VWA domain-containing protein [Planctomycetes bacterium]|nr:VWA domain-containing protein [Planctomycetota bacterium]